MPAPVTLMLATALLTTALTTSALAASAEAPGTQSPLEIPTAQAAGPTLTDTARAIPVVTNDPTQRSGVAASSRWNWPVGSAQARPLILRGFAVGPYAWSPGHRGADLAVAPGEPLHAPAAGTVTFSGQVAGRPVLVVTHDGLRSTFVPATATVPVGTLVAAGDTVGRVTAGGAHGGGPGDLHWGVIRGRTYLDPLPFVRGGATVRLLPWGDD